MKLIVYEQFELNPKKKKKLSIFVYLTNESSSSLSLFKIDY